MRFLFLLLLAITCNLLHAQNRLIDSLKKSLLSNPAPAQQLNTYLALASQFRSISSDALLEFSSQASSLAAEQKNTVARIWADCYYGIGCVKKGQYQTAIDLADSNLISLEKKQSEPQLQAELLFLRGGAYMRQSRYKEAMTEYLEALHRSEKSGDFVQQIRAKSGVGWVNMELGKHREAMQWFLKALNTTTGDYYTDQYPTLYSNTSSTYNNIGQYDSAFYFARKAISASEKIQDLGTLASALNIEADIYINTGNNQKAEEDLKRALEIRKQIGDVYYVVSDMGQLAGFYSQNGETVKGINVAQEAIAIAQKANLVSKLTYLYEMLAANYKAAGDFKNYSLTQEKIISIKDSLYEKNSAESLAEIQAKYELQKKENIIMRQQYELNKSRYITIGSYILFSLGLLFVWVLYRNYRLVQKRKMEAALAEERLLAYKAVEQAEENERKRIAADLHDNLGSYAAAITANVKYFKDKSGIENDNTLLQLEGNAQNMVTQLGDTIWVLKNEKLPVTKLADRFKSWMLRLMQNYPHIRYHYQEDITRDFEFSPSRILHIFLILKECVNNAVKHSDCNEIYIQVFSDNSNWRVIVQDNGKGFNKSLVQKESGISNIKNRANESGWHVEWQSVQPTGTKVVISGPTTK